MLQPRRVPIAGVPWAPVLGVAWVGDRWDELPTDGRLGFQAREWALLQGASPVVWTDVALVKAVFPGSAVLERVNLVRRRQRRERSWAQGHRFTRGPIPAADEADDEG